jgi:hypothetical protein
LGKKSLKKNKYSVNTNVDIYKEEFSNNIKLTLLNNIFKKNFNFNSSINFLNLKTKFNDNILLDSGYYLNDLFLKTKKSSFSVENFLNNDNKYLFLNFLKENFFKTGFFKKSQKFINNKDITNIDSLILKTVKT